MKQLIIFRAFQGIGGSAIYSAVIVTFSTMVPKVRNSLAILRAQELSFW